MVRRDAAGGALAALESRRANFGRLVSEFDRQEFGCIGNILTAQLGRIINAVLCTVTASTVHVAIDQAWRAMYELSF